MDCFMIGASGYIGGAIAAKLQLQGHQVTGLARSVSTAQRLSLAGIRAVDGSIQDLSLLARHALSADAIIYSAIEFTPAGFEAEYQAIQALLTALNGTDKPLIFTSGVGVLGNSFLPMNEDSPYHPWPLVERRVATEQLLYSAAELKQVRATVIRPGMVYGNGREINGLDLYIRGALKLGLAPYLNQGPHYWPVVHLDDLTELYLLAIQQSVSEHALIHGVTEETVTFKQIAQAVASHFSLPHGAVSWHSTQLAEEWGAEAEIFGIDQRLQRSRAIDSLGWHPKHRGILDEIAQLATTPDAYRAP